MIDFFVFSLYDDKPTYLPTLYFDRILYVMICNCICFKYIKNNKFIELQVFALIEYTRHFKKID